jgi:hypothetical protein
MQLIKSYKEVSRLHCVIRVAMAQRLTWRCRDVYEFCDGKYSMSDINHCIGSMIQGRHVLRISRGLYRFRGIV